jgi:gluconokinase
VVLVLMGVVGAGKTTIGTLLAQKLGWDFVDADNFHPAENVKKIRRGIALTDADRVPWLTAMHGAIVQWNRTGQNVVLACSALKRSYRQHLRAGDVKFVYLKGSCELILQRLRARHGHFATESILDTQFRDLEEPEDALIVAIDPPPEQIAAEIIGRLGLMQNSANADFPASN